MTEDKFKEGLIDCLRRAHYLDVAFIYGEDYVMKNQVWIEYDFERKLKRMTANDWERVTKSYIEALKEGENNETM